MSTEMTCYEAIRDLDSAMLEAVPLEMDYLVLGGIASAALCDPSTRIEDGFIYADKKSDIPTLRKNKTRRDVDVLITGVLDAEEKDALNAVIAGAVDDELVTSVSGFRRHKLVNGGINRVVTTARTWTSDRTIDECGVHRYELFPLEQAVPRETYKPWMLVLPDGSQVQVLHPVGHLLAYRMRSSSGLRPKDIEKFTAMNRNVMSRPGMRDELYDGIFKDWFTFAQAIPDVLAGDIYYGDRRLVPGASGHDLSNLRTKGRVLHEVESHPLVVKFAQEGPLKKVLDAVIGVR